jgi:hypothetical protein
MSVLLRTDDSLTECDSGMELVQGEDHEFLKPFPIFCLPETLERVRGVFPYLVKDAGAPDPKVQRLISRLQFNEVNAFESFDCAGLRMTALPLEVPA